jgi:nucleotide-binding universal stress UspA family protein
VSSEEEEDPDFVPSERQETTVPARTFLCVVDESEELHQALRYACRRAKKTGGRVALLYVIEPVEYQHWISVGQLMAEERREQAEELLQVVSSVVQRLSGRVPIIYIREGNLTEQLMQLLETEADLSVLVLGAATGSDGPGRIVNYVMKRIGRLPIPVTFVPGGLSDEQIDAIT